MAYKEMTATPSAMGNNTDIDYYGEVSLASAANSDIILLPKGIKTFSCTVSVGSGAQAKVQTSTDSRYTVQSGSPIWIDWASGLVSANTSASAYKVTAVRLVQSGTGTSKLTVVA